LFTHKKITGGHQIAIRNKGSDGTTEVPICDTLIFIITIALALQKFPFPYCKHLYFFKKLLVFSPLGSSYYSFPITGAPFLPQ
jgi:hypothetical protein